MSLRIVPAPNRPNATAPTRGAPSAPGLPDTLRDAHKTSTTSSSAPSQQAPNVTSSHPLEARLTQWTATQKTLQSTILRQNFGIALPLRMAMEQKMVFQADGFRPSVLGPASGVHGDILMGRDTAIDWEDVYNGQDGLRGQHGDSAVGFIDEIEEKVKMGKW